MINLYRQKEEEEGEKEKEKKIFPTKKKTQPTTPARWKRTRKKDLQKEINIRQTKQPKVINNNSIRPPAKKSPAKTKYNLMPDGVPSHVPSY